MARASAHENLHVNALFQQWAGPVLDIDIDAGMLAVAESIEPGVT